MEKDKKTLYEKWDKKSDDFFRKHPKFPLYFSIVALAIVLTKEILF